MSDLSNLPVEAEINGPSDNATDKPSDVPGTQVNAQRPPYGHAQLIGRALLSSPDRPLTVAEIIKWLRESYAYYRDPAVNVSSNVSATLSLHKDFVKQEKPSDSHGRANLWSIVPSARHKYLSSFSTQPPEQSQTPLSFATGTDTMAEIHRSNRTTSHRHRSHHTTPTDFTVEAEMTTSGEEKPSEVQRLKEVCVLLESISKSQQQEIEKVSEAVQRIEKTMSELSGSIEQIRHEMQMPSHGVTPAGQHNYVREIELLTAKVTSIGRKAHEVDELKLQLGLMNARVKKMGEVGGGADTMQSTDCLTLRGGPPILADSQETSALRPVTSTGAVHEDAHLPNRNDELPIYQDDAYDETVNANNKRSRQASRDLGHGNDAIDENADTHPAASLLVFDDPEDIDYKPAQQRGTSTVRRARGGTRGRKSRGNARQSLPGRFPTPEWEKPDFTYEPAPDGFYSPIVTPNSRRGRKVARRGTGGAYSEPKRAKVQGDQTAQFPLRNEDGIRLMPNGKPDMRGQWRRAKEQKKMPTEPGIGSGTQEQQDHNKMQNAMGPVAFPSVTRNEADDTVEQGSTMNDINNPKHAAVMKMIFPSGVSRQERGKDLAEQLFGRDEDDEVQTATRRTEVAATETGSSEEV